MRLQGPGCGWGVVVVSAAALLLLTALGLALALVLTRESPLAPRTARCGGVLTDSEGSFSSPNHPGSYPPNSLCVWVIRVPPPSTVQVHVSSLSVEGPSPCLFDWLEVQEQTERSSVVTRLVKRQQSATTQTLSGHPSLSTPDTTCTLHFIFCFGLPQHSYVALIVSLVSTISPKSVQDYEALLGTEGTCGYFDLWVICILGKCRNNCKIVT
uniref:CUB domain-containing protein n=1 Tax=Scophthalmus maximus TaxID=52904 RepID=A0A8D3BNT3_SCOMX